MVLNWQNLLFFSQILSFNLFGVSCLIISQQMTFFSEDVSFCGFNMLFPSKQCKILTTYVIHSWITSASFFSAKDFLWISYVFEVQSVGRAVFSVIFSAIYPQFVNRLQSCWGGGYNCRWNCRNTVDRSICNYTSLLLSFPGVCAFQSLCSFSYPRANNVMT